MSVSADDIATVTAQRDAATVAQILAINNKTQQALDNLKVTYKTSIETSSKSILNRWQILVII